MPEEASERLVRALHKHNHWWEEGTDGFSLPHRQKSDYYHLVRPDKSGSQFEDQQLLGITGRRGVGKTTLIHQFIHHRIDSGDEPERFLYCPFDADPLFQLQSDEQLVRAVRYYENRVLGRLDDDSPHFILLDDVHQIEHPSKPDIDGWGGPVASILDEESGRHITVTATAGVQVERELDRVGVDADRDNIQHILPEKFRDYLYTLYPEFEEEDQRVSPTSLRTGESSLPTAIETGDIQPFIGELRNKHEQVSEHERRIQARLLDYLAIGGSISYEHDGAIESITDVEQGDYRKLRTKVRQALYQEVPGFESIQTIADLERLCALAARNRAAEPFRYQELVELLDVDRRTIADSYLPALEELYLLTGITEYDNSRPRSVRLYLRDTGLFMALIEGEASNVRNDFDLEADLAHLAAFDHTMRFAYGINAEQGRDEMPTVQYWRGKDGVVDFVFEFDGTPIPIGLVYSASDREETLSALREFQDTYDSPLGLFIVGDTLRGAKPVHDIGNGIVQLPFLLYMVLC